MTTTRGLDLVPRLITVDDAIRMTEAGILAEGERVELVDGLLVEMSPEGPAHRWLALELTTFLARTYPDPYRVGSQSTLHLDELNLREPDVSVVSATSPDRWSVSDEIPLLIEISDTSLRRDLGPKALDHARFGIPAYWVIDLQGRRLVAHSQPSPDGYGVVRAHGERETVRLPRTGVDIEVARLLLPPATGQRTPPPGP